MVIMKKICSGVMAMVCLQLAACGGGGSGTVDLTPAQTIMIGAPVVTLAFGMKELRFSWSTVSGATHYRLLENPDGTSGFTQVGTDISALSVNHAIPVHRRLNASYIVQACNSGGCANSATQILGANLTQAIGYVKASNPGAGDQFGFAVAVSGDGNTLAVGALAEDSSTAGTPNEAAADAGAVYVFVRNGNTWSQQAYVKPSNTGVGDNFGFSIALSVDGNTLAVGAPLEDSSTTGIGSVPNEAAAAAGAVYVFVRNAGVWSQQAYVKASNTGAGDNFGAAIALSSDGSKLAVGASLEDSSTTGIGSVSNNAAADAGAVYVYTRSAGIWSQQAYVKASNTGAGDRFGKSVALAGDGNTLAVGAWGEDSSATGIGGTSNEAATDAGAVYVFIWNDTTWSQQAYVKASNTGAGDNFGFSVALSGDGNTMAVGAHLEDSSTTGIGSASDNLASNAGAAYVFARNGTAWLQQAYVKASNTGADDTFGAALALSSDGNTLAVGASLEDGSGTGIGSLSNETAAGAGAVYVFIRTAGIWSQKSTVKASNTGAGDSFGHAVALSGDGNALAVGSIGEDSSSIGIGGAPNEAATSAGAVHLY